MQAGKSTSAAGPGGGVILTAGAGTSTGGSVTLAAGAATAVGGTGGTLTLTAGAGASSTAAFVAIGTAITLRAGSVSSVSDVVSVQTSAGVPVVSVDTGTADRTTINSQLKFTSSLIGTIQYPVADPLGGDFVTIKLQLGMVIHIGGSGSFGTKNNSVRLDLSSILAEDGMILIIYNGHSASSSLETFMGAGTSIAQGVTRLYVYVGSAWTTPS